MNTQHIQRAFARFDTNETSPKRPVLPAIDGARAAANDESATEDPNVFRNPLWIIAIAMGCFFAVTGSIIALG
jgi:hypothetical protein